MYTCRRFVACQLDYIQAGVDALNVEFGVSLGRIRGSFILIYSGTSNNEASDMHSQVYTVQYLLNAPEHHVT